MNLSEKDIARFWSKVDKRTEGECWEWQASLKSSGYGQIRFNVGPKKNIVVYAHRIAWIITHGEIPEGLMICHTCDNPKCVNPSHMFPGTASDNQQDSIRKNRRHMPSGSAHAHAKLDEVDIPVIRSLVEAGHTKKAVARLFRVDESVIRKIVKREIWDHV